MKWVMLALAVLLLLWLGAGYAMFVVFCVRRKNYDPASKENVEHGSHGEYAVPILEGQAWAESMQPEPVSVQSYDGLRLVGRFIEHPQPRGTAILFHGYRSRWNLDFSCSMRFYYELGFSLLAVDQRAQGESEGRYMTYGVRERYDVLSWIDYVNQRLGPETPILIGGLSMGATTVQLACGLELPKNVRAAVSDCGFTSAYEIGKHVLQRAHLPWPLLLPQVALLCRLFAGFGVKECSTLAAQRRNRIPTFFAHGEDDDFVPCEMTRRSFRACRAEKQLLTVPGARHGVSYMIDRPRYEREISAFLDRYF